MKRRELLLGSGGVTLALLAGRVPTAQAASDKTQEETAESPLELLPAESALDVEYTRIVRIDLEETEESDRLTHEARVVDRIDGLDVSDAEAVVTAWTKDELSLGAITGSFDRPEPGETVDEPGEWWVGTTDDLAIASTDDQLVFARERGADATDKPIDAAESSCEVARNDGETVLETLDLLGEAYDRFGDKREFYFLTDLESGMPSTIPDPIQTLSAGFEKSVINARGHDETVENEYLFEVTSDTDLDDDAVTELLEELEQGTVVDIETEYDDDVVFIEATIDVPPERNREAAPDASIVMESDVNAGTVEIRHTGGEPVPAEKLELWVNGELADPQPADEFDEFTSGDSLTVDTGPLASVYLRWIDEEENEYYDYVDSVVGSDAFEVAHDPAAETVELTYTAEADADSDRLELVHRKQIRTDGKREIERTKLTEEVDALGGTLSTGDSLVVEGVGMRDTVTLDLDIPPKPAGVYGPETSLVEFHVRPPRLHVSRRPEEAPVVEYHDETSRDAEEFRILVDGAEADTQLADEHDTLDRGDAVQLDAVDFGSEIVIEWVTGDEPVVVETELIRPHLHLGTTYDAETGTVTVEHLDGETVEADALEVLVGGEVPRTQPEDQHDRFGPEDTVTVPADPFERVVVRWRGETTLRLHHDVVGGGLFEASYDIDDETVELIYTGERAADASHLELERFGPESTNEESDGPFDDVETLASGDSVTVEEVDPDETIQIVHTGGETGHYPLFHFSVTPRYAFSFEEQDGTTVLEYDNEVARDADEFRILVDGTEAETQPGDVHETLEAGDTVELGSHPPGTTVVIEWPRSGEPSQVQEHLVMPEATFAVNYDEDEGTLRIEHAGGDDLEADDLGVYAPPVTNEGLADWDGDGTVTEGDSTTLDAEEQPEVVLVVFRESEVLYERELDD